ncbi:MAG: hypothetical protein ACTSRS_07680 [Candidatus Helarchaeota archaeon]
MIREIMQLEETEIIIRLFAEILGTKSRHLEELTRSTGGVDSVNRERNSPS